MHRRDFSRSSAAATDGFAGRQPAISCRARRAEESSGVWASSNSEAARRVESSDSSQSGWNLPVDAGNSQC